MSSFRPGAQEGWPTAGTQRQGALWFVDQGDEGKLKPYYVQLAAGAELWLVTRQGQPPASSASLP